jgi:hypothetical protein
MLPLHYITKFIESVAAIPDPDAPREKDQRAKITP